jgi:FAD/FMN-containing dehydrogenase
MYGLVSDAFIKLNVVLADGSAVTVSDNSHQDLFWAMRGAGHNFGIVTSFETKIWPKNLDTWYYRNLIFTQDKLEALFTELNKLGGNGTQPKELGHYGMYLKAAGIADVSLETP